MDLNLGVQSDTDKKLKKKLLIDYLYANLKQHNFWAYRYFFCEFLAFINVTGWSVKGGHNCDREMTAYFGNKHTCLFLQMSSRNAMISPSPCFDIFLILGQIILLDKFFDGTFFTYGIEVMAFADRDQAWVAVLTTFIKIIWAPYVAKLMIRGKSKNT